MGVQVIAEVGVNHCGSIDLALELTRCASDAGADAVKFQMFRSDELAGTDAPLADYQMTSAASAHSQREMLQSLELDQEAMAQLKWEADRLGIEFMCTAFDPMSLRELLAIGLERIKVPSGEITNRVLLEEVAQHQMPTLLSTGMATVDEIGEAISVLQGAGLDASAITLLHCTSLYPTPLEDANIRALISLRERFGLDVGFSDHTLGSSAALAAVALGAAVIEKHLTLDRSLPGPDHAASLEPMDFAALVRSVHEVEESLGTGAKEPRPAEWAMREAARRSLVAAQDIPVGARFTPDNITSRRPGTGLSPMRAPELYGTQSSRAYLAGDRIEWP